MMGFQKFLRPFGSKRAELERKKLEKFLRSVSAQALRGVSLRSRHELLKDDLCVELAGYLVDDYHYSPEEAIGFIPPRPLSVCRKTRRVSTTRVRATSIHFCRMN